MVLIDNLICMYCFCISFNDVDYMVEKKIFRKIRKEDKIIKRKKKSDQDLIQMVASFTDIDYLKRYWDTYDEMNPFIKLRDKHPYLFFGSVFGMFLLSNGIQIGLNLLLLRLLSIKGVVLRADLWNDDFPISKFMLYFGCFHGVILLCELVACLYAVVYYGISRLARINKQNNTERRKKKMTVEDFNRVSYSLSEIKSKRNETTDEELGDEELKDDTDDDENIHPKTPLEVVVDTQ